MPEITDADPDGHTLHVRTFPCRSEQVQIEEVLHGWMPSAHIQLVSDADGNLDPDDLQVDVVATVPDDDGNPGSGLQSLAALIRDAADALDELAAGEVHDV